MAESDIPHYLKPQEQLKKEKEDQQKQIKYLKEDQQKQIKYLSNKIETLQTLFEEYETNIKINYFVNKVIDFKISNEFLFIRTDGNILNLANESLGWEKFIIEQSKIPGRYFIKSNHFKTFLFYNIRTDTLLMKQHPIHSECSTFKFI
ncbi:hypothetical protein ACTA71_000250 [Dictyostelium dimigraforme]